MSGRGLLAGQVDTDPPLLRLWEYVVMDQKRKRES